MRWILVEGVYTSLKANFGHTIGESFYRACAPFSSKVFDFFSFKILRHYSKLIRS